MSTLRRLGSAAALAVAFFGVKPAHAYTTEMLQASGDSANRLDLVIMGDGYRAEDQTKMKTDAQKVMNAIFAEPYWAAYKNFVNVKLVHVISNQDGADGGMYGSGSTRDTALGAYYYCFDIDRLICMNNGAVMSVAFNDAPEYDQILVIVNDTTYGGSGGGYSVTSMDPGAVDIPIHEIGHSLFGLADEYEYGSESYGPCDAQTDCPEPNATVRTALNDIKWNYWIDNGTPLPTPETNQYASKVGLFEGSRYYGSGQYRPWNDCLMRSLGRSLCPVCAEAAVLRTYDYANLEDSHSPTAATVSMTTADTTTFSVTGPRPIPNTVSGKWYKNGSLLAGPSSDSEDISGATLGVGTHELKVDLSDDTTLVRLDPSDKLLATRSWQVTVTEAPSNTGGAGSGGAASTGGGAATGGGAGAGASSTGGANSGATGGTTGGDSNTGGTSEDRSPPSDPSDDDGCACSTAPQSSSNVPGAVALSLAALAAVRRGRVARVSCES